MSLNDELHELAKESFDACVLPRMKTDKHGVYVLFHRYEMMSVFNKAADGYVKQGLGMSDTMDTGAGIQAFIADSAQEADSFIKGIERVKKSFTYRLLRNFDTEDWLDYARRFHGMGIESIISRHNVNTHNKLEKSAKQEFADFIAPKKGVASDNMLSKTVNAQTIDSLSDTMGTYLNERFGPIGDQEPGAGAERQWQNLSRKLIIRIVSGVKPLSLIDFDRFESDLKLMKMKHELLISDEVIKIDSNDALSEDVQQEKELPSKLSKFGNDMIMNNMRRTLAASVSLGLGQLDINFEGDSVKVPHIRDLGNLGGKDCMERRLDPDRMLDMDEDDRRHHICMAVVDHVLNVVRCQQNNAFRDGLSELSRRMVKGAVYHQEVVPLVHKAKGKLMESALNPGQDFDM